MATPTQLVTWRLEYFTDVIGVAWRLTQPWYRTEDDVIVRISKLRMLHGITLQMRPQNVFVDWEIDEKPDRHFDNDESFRPESEVIELQWAQGHGS